MVRFSIILLHFVYPCNIVVIWLRFLCRQVSFLNQMILIALRSFASARALGFEHLMVFNEGHFKKAFL